MPKRGNKKQNESPQFPLFVKELPDEYDEEVRDCFQATIARNIYPHEELRSLLWIRLDAGPSGIAKVGTRYVMTHVNGNLFVDEAVLSEVVGHCRLASSQELKSLGLEQGRVNPWTAKHYLGEDVTHIVSPLVLALDDVQTNNNTLRKGIEFDPRQLTQLLSPCLEYEIATDVPPPRRPRR